MAKVWKREGKLNSCINPYSKEGTSENIFYEIRKYLQQDKSVVKKFYDIKF